MNQRTAIVAIAVMAVGITYIVPTGTCGISVNESRKLSEQVFLITNTLVTKRDIRVLLTQSAGAQSPEPVTHYDSRTVGVKRVCMDQKIHHILRPP